MAKASRADLDAAHALDRAFESLLRYRHEPAEQDGEESEQRFDIDDPASCRRVVERLLAIAKRGSLMRVVMGLDVLLDPRNEIVDPDLDYLAPHPKAVAAFAAAAANASGTDTSHSAAGDARSEDGSAAQRAEPDPEVLRVRAPAGAPAGGEQAGGRLGAGDGGEAAAGAGAVGGPAEAARGEGLPLSRGPVGAKQTTPDEVAGTPATSDDRGGPDDGAPPAPPAVEAGGGGVFGLDLVAHLHRQRDFSLRTFGPGPRSAGVVDHIRKELIEIEAAPSDLAEWIDVVILAFDGAWRIGATPEQIVAALQAKQAKNEARTWPDWRKADPSKAIEHDRSQDAGGGV